MLKNIDENITVSNNKYIQIDGGSNNYTYSGVVMFTGGGDDLAIDSKAFSIRYTDTTKSAKAVYNDSVLITATGTGDADTITNYYDNVTVYCGGGGADEIHNFGSNVTIDGGDGDDKIGNKGSNVSINGGAGNDNITLDGAGDSITVNLGDGDDTINFDGDSITSLFIENFENDADLIKFYGTIQSAGDISGGGVSVTAVTSTRTQNVSLQAVNYSWSSDSINTNISCDASTLSGAQSNGSSLTSFIFGTADTLFTIDGLDTPTGLGVNVYNSIVTVDKSALIGVTRDVSIDSGYSFALGDHVEPEAYAASTGANVTELEQGTDENNNPATTISEDGVYELPKDFTGTLTITAANVKIIGAKDNDGNIIPLTDVFIVMSPSEGSGNLWIEDLYLTTEKDSNLIKFTSKDCTLTVEGTNTLKNTAASGDVKSAVINVDGIQLGITGDGKLTVEQTSNKSYGAALGTNYHEDKSSASIDIGGNVTVIAKSVYGAGIGSGAYGDSAIGGINIGGNATVIAESDYGAGIGAGTLASAGDVNIGGNAKVTATSIETNGNINQGEDATVNVDPENITCGENASIGTDVDGLDVNIINISEPVGENVAWSLESGSAFYIKGATTSGHSLTSSGDTKDNFLKFITASPGETLVALGGIFTGNSTLTPSVEGSTVILSPANFDGNVSILSNDSLYSFSLSSGNYNNYSFTGTKDADSISNAGNYITVIGGAGADSIYNIGSSVTIDGGAGADYIYNNGSSVTIDGGLGDDLITLTDLSSMIAVNVGDGKDTILVGNSVSSLTVLNFGAGDEIHLAASISAISDSSIRGLDSIAPIYKDWSLNLLSSGTASLVLTRDEGAYLDTDFKTIKYGSGAGAIESIAALTNIADLNGLSVGANGSVITISSAALDRKTVELTSKNDFYSITISEDVDTLQESLNGWYAENGNAAFYTDGTGDYYSLESDNKTLAYHESLAGTAHVKLSGVNVDGLTEPNNGVVNLNATDFAGNVSVLSNASLYAFNLGSGEYNYSFSGTSDADSITNAGSKLTIDGGEGADSIYNIGNNVSVNGGIGADSITNRGDMVSINGGSGKDSITNSGSNVSINGGSGNDSINLTGGSNISVNVGDGKDTILVGSGITSLTVENFDAGDKIIFNDSIESVEYVSDGLQVTLKDGSVITIKGLGNITSEETWLNVNNGTATFGRTSGYDYVKNGKELTYQNFDAATYFTLENLKSDATTEELAEAIEVNETTITFNSDDVLESTKEVTAPDGYTFAINDSLKSVTAEISWTQDETDTSKYTYAEAGNTEGWLLDGNKLVHRDDERGSFTISGLSDDLTTEAGEIPASVTISDGKVQVSSDAFSSDHKTISLSGTSYELEVTDSLIENIDFKQSGKQVTLSGSTAGYVKNDDGDYVWQEQVGGETLTITGLKKKATLTESMFTHKGDKIIFKPTQKLLPKNPKKITISDGVIDTSDLKTTKEVAGHWSGSTWISDKTASSWTNNAATVKYTPATGGEELFKVDNVDLTNVTPELVDGVYKISLPEGSFNKSDPIKVTKINADATLEFDGIVTSAEPVEANLTAAGVYTSEYTPEYFAPSTSGDVTTYIYQPTTGYETFTISGLSLTSDLNGAEIDDYLTVDNNAVTVKAVNGGLENYSGDGITLTGTDKALEFADSLKFTSDKQHAAEFTRGKVRGKTATFNYKGAYTDAYFDADGKFVPSTESQASTFRVTNLKKTSDSAALLNQLSDDTLTLTSDFLAGKTVTISNGYKLAAASDVIMSQKVNAGWSDVVDGKASYYATDGNTQGYTLTDKSTKLKYTDATPSATLTLSGITSTDGFTVDGANVKFNTKALKNITADGATLDGGEFIADTTDKKLKESKTYAADSWDGFDYYAAEAKTAGYKLDGTKLQNVAESGGKAFTISGVKSTDGITVADNIVTLTAANLNKKKVTVDNADYSLNLDDSVTTSAVKKDGAFTKFKNGVATYTTAIYSDYYTLENNEVVYTKASKGKSITIANLNPKSKLAAIKSGIDVTEQTDGSYKITFKDANVLTSKSPTVSAVKGISYTLAVAEELEPTELALAWEVSGSNASLKSGTSAGYIVLDNQVIYVAQKDGAAQAVLGGLAENATLNVPDDKVITLDSKLLGTDAYLESNAGNYSVKLVGNMSGKTFTGTSDADTLNIASNNVAIKGGQGLIQSPTAAPMSR